MADPPLLLKLALLAFWTAWFAVVFLSNLFGGLKAMGRLPASWVFASRNYEAVVKAAGAIDLALAAAALGGAMLLWAAFMLADEVTLKYEFERSHELLFLSQAATLGLMHLP